MKLPDYIMYAALDGRAVWPKKILLRNGFDSQVRQKSDTFSFSEGPVNLWLSHFESSNTILAKMFHDKGRDLLFILNLNESFQEVTERISVLQDVMEASSEQRKFFAGLLKDIEYSCAVREMGLGFFLNGATHRDRIV